MCWAYDDDASLGAAAGRFLAGGLARGEHGLCVGDRVIDSLPGDTAALAGIDRLLGDGVLETLTTAEAYAAVDGFSPERQPAFYDAATSRAPTDVASAHPLVHAGAGVPPFQVFFDDHRLTVAGSVDTFGAGRLARMLATSPVEGPVAVLDLGRLDFVDAAGCRTIALWGRDLADHAVGREIRGASTLVRRVWRLLALTEIAPVHFPEDDR